MKEQQITCPHCGNKFALSQIMTQQIEEKLKIKYKQIVAEKEIEFKNMLEEKDDEYKVKYEKKMENDIAIIKKDALKKAKNKLAEDFKEKDDEINELKKKVIKYKKSELKIKTKEKELDDREHTLELEFQERLRKQSNKIYQDVKDKMEEQYKLKNAENDKTIEDLKKKINDLQRKAEQGSTQLKGEVQEIELEKILKDYFVYDEIKPVGVGKRGADIIQIVKSETGKNSGVILWESKRTKNWTESWIEKLKNDMRQSKYDIAVIVTETLPNDISNFSFRDGVWITDFRYVIGLAIALRINLIQVYQARLAMAGVTEKRDLVYSYLTGNEFRQRVESLVESFKIMQDDLSNEKTAMEKIWAKREKQIKVMVQNVVGIFGDLQGLGANLLPVKNLELTDK